MNDAALPGIVSAFETGAAGVATSSSRRVAAGSLRTVGNSLIGRGADVIVIDDPIAPALVLWIKARRNAVKNVVRLRKSSNASTTRRPGAVIVVMQRLHIDDLSGYLLGGDQLQNHPKWVHLNMPAVAVEGRTVWELV